MQRRARAIFYSAAVFTFVMATLPQPPTLPGTPSDKVQHILAFATLAVLGAFAYPKASLLRIWLWLLALGAAIELAQAIPILHRDSELADLLADGAAALVAILGVAWLRRRCRE